MENSSHRYFPEIDVVRAVACLLVAIVHVSVPNWSTGIQDPNFIERVILGIVKTGWIGVPLFLFLSGYSLAINKTKPGYQLNTKQFFINRALRIFPLWITCLFILKWSHKLTGEQFVSLLMLNLQDLPPANAFNIGWSIQLEFYCYFLFPMLVYSMASLRQTFLIFATLLAIKGIVCSVPTRMAWELAYSNVIGGATLFFSGILARKFLESNSVWKKTVWNFRYAFIIAGLVFIISLQYFITWQGGYQEASSRLMTIFFLIMPELFSGGFAMVLIPYFLIGAKRTGKLSVPTRVFAYIGTVSYSAYLFSLFVHDFVYGVFISNLGLITSTGWLAWGAFLCIYLPMLVGFASLTYYTIEKPFLARRKKY